jgi:hypothetical protein
MEPLQNNHRVRRGLLLRQIIFKKRASLQRSEKPVLSKESGRLARLFFTQEFFHFKNPNNAPLYPKLV